MVGRGGTVEARSGAVLGAELGYGVEVFGGFGVATPCTRFERSREGRRDGWGWRLGRGPGEAFALDLEGSRRERYIQSRAQRRNGRARAGREPRHGTRPEGRRRDVLPPAGLLPHRRRRQHGQAACALVAIKGGCEPANGDVVVARIEDEVTLERFRRER